MMTMNSTRGTGIGFEDPGATQEVPSRVDHQNELYLIARSEAAERRAEHHWAEENMGAVRVIEVRKCYERKY